MSIWGSPWASTSSSADKNDKGYFADETALLASYPNGIATPSDRAGWNAILGSTGSVWLWDVGTNVWIDSALSGTVQSVDGLTAVIDARYDNAVFFGKAGNDADDGRSYLQRKLTLGAAKAAASGLTPSAAIPVTIVCVDGGVYTEDYTNVAFVHLIAPGINLTGNVVAAEDCIMEIGTVTGNLTVSAAKVLKCTIREITGTVTKTGKIRGIVGADYYVRNVITEA